MLVFKFTAHRIPGHDADREAQAEAFDYLLDALRQDGHVLGRELTTVSLEHRLDAYLMVPGRDAFEERYQNKLIKERLSGLKAVGLSDPEIEELGQDPCGFNECLCSEHPYYVLYTSYTALYSPVRCGNCFHSIPLYRLPRFDGRDHLVVITWMDDYDSCDSLFMNSNTGERFGYREISQAGSSLSRRGREICAELEKSTGIRTYYFLYRHYGRNPTHEEKRPCPNCGRPWFLPERLHDLIDFKCDDCRLVSAYASTLT